MPCSRQSKSESRQHDRLSGHPDKLLTVNDVAQRLQVSTQCVYSMVARGKLAHVRVGIGRGTIRFLQHDLDTFIHEHRNEKNEDDPVSRPPRGRAAPANLAPDPGAEAWGVLYRITRADLLHLDSTEGVPGLRYRQLWVDAEDIDERPLRAVTYIADGKPADGNPSLRYITLLREGARAHRLPQHYLRFLDSVENAE